MSADVKLQRAREKDSAKLFEEMREFSPEVPTTQVLYALDEVSVSEKLGQQLKASLPFVKGRMRQDCLVFQNYPLKQGRLQVMLPYSRNILLPVEYLFRFPGRIPRSVFLKRSLGGGAWTSAAGDEFSKEEFCVYLKDLKQGKGILAARLSYKADWSLTLGKSKIKLQWAFQMIPLPGDEILWIHKKPYDSGFMGGVSSFGVKKVFEIYEWLRQAIADLKYAGQQGIAELLVPSLSPLGDPGLAQEFGLDPLLMVYRPASGAPPPPKQAPAQPAPAAAAPAPDPLSIAKQRLAAGEISIEEFERIKTALGG